MTCHLVPYSIFGEYTSKHNMFIKHSNICSITINDGPTSRVLALTSSKWCSNTFLKLLWMQHLFSQKEHLPDVPSGRKGKSDNLRKKLIKAEAKAAAFSEGQGIHFCKQSTAQNIRVKTLLPKRCHFMALAVSWVVCLPEGISFSHCRKNPKDVNFMAK